jgi:hypothetical protein
MIQKEFPEEFVVKSLLSKSIEFSEFYKNERNKILSSLIWVKSDKLPVGITGRLTTVNNQHYIYLRKIPPNISDDLLIAHELQHLIHREYYKIPGTGSFQQGLYHNLSSAINSSIHDQLVNRDLLKYDFDLCSEFEEEIINSKRDLRNIINEPNDVIGSLHWAVNYASKKIDYTFINREYEYEDKSFFNWFENRYPKVAKQSEQIEKTLLSVDLNSIESIVSYFKWIISEYKLSPIIALPPSF